jgi:hypothetical protein
VSGRATGYIRKFFTRSGACDWSTKVCQAASSGLMSPTKKEKKKENKKKEREKGDLVF